MPARQPFPGRAPAGHAASRGADGRWHCAKCDLSFAQRPESRCPGVHVYGYWPRVPGHLRTKTQLAAAGLVPPPAPAGCIPAARRWIWLYDVAAATPKRAATPAQRAALARARATQEARRQAEIKAEWDRLSEEERLEAEQREADHQAAVAWARALAARSDWVALDLETTGLDGDIEIVEIAILSPTGKVLLESLVRPVRSIPPEAIAIHGITDAMVAYAPTLPAIHAAIAAAIRDREVLVYNVAYDRPVLGGVCERHGLPRLVAKRWTCAMEWYAQWYGDQTADGDYRWHALPGGGHSAIEDARAVIRLIRRMAQG
jgi:DNA polymerase-3 subunit epsilon